jgi:hypothetical protein
VLENEVRHFAAGLPHIDEVIILPQELHNEPARLRQELQIAVDRAESRPEIQSIVLVFGLCSRGVENLRHERCSIVIARAHDCLTLYLGDKDRYAEYLRRHPGTYWYTTGWIKSGAPPGPEREAHLRREYAKKFDAEDVEYLMGVDRESMAKYNRATFVDLGIDETAGAVDYTRHCAACLGWDFDRVAGDPSLLRDLLAGPWDERRFLIVPPLHTIRLTADGSIVRAVPPASPP